MNSRIITLGEVTDWLKAEQGRRVHVNIGWGFTDSIIDLLRTSPTEVLYSYNEGQYVTYPADRTFHIVAQSRDYLSLKLTKESGGQCRSSK